VNGVVALSQLVSKLRRTVSVVKRVLPGVTGSEAFTRAATDTLQRVERRGKQVSLCTNTINCVALLFS
jgi:hypothetical protein